MAREKRGAMLAVCTLQATARDVVEVEKSRGASVANHPTLLGLTMSRDIARSPLGNSGSCLV
jgi:hypothetical protein